MCWPVAYSLLVDEHVTLTYCTSIYATVFFSSVKCHGLMALGWVFLWSIPQLACTPSPETLALTHRSIYTSWSIANSKVRATRRCSTKTSKQHVFIRKWTWKSLVVFTDGFWMWKLNFIKLHVSPKKTCFNPLKTDLFVRPQLENCIPIMKKSNHKVYLNIFCVIIKGTLVSSTAASGTFLVQTKFPLWTIKFIYLSVYLSMAVWPPLALA